MLFVRLAWGGVVEVEDAVSGVVSGDVLVLSDASGRSVARFPRIDVVAFGAERTNLDQKREPVRR